MSTKTYIYLTFVMAVLGLVSMFIGAYQYDHGALTNRDLIFVAPLSFCVVAFVTLILAWVQEEKEHAR